MNRRLQLKLFPLFISTLLYIILSFFTSYSFASDITKCPDINSIKAEGFGEAEKSFFGSYYPTHISAYDTKVNWRFVIQKVNGYGPKTAEEAIEWGNKILQNTVSGEPTPDFITCKRNDTCIASCKYEVGFDYAEARTTDYY